MQIKRGTMPSVMAATEDGQEAHPQVACTNYIIETSQAPAAFERRLFWLLFVPTTKSNIPQCGPRYYHAAPQGEKNYIPLSACITFSMKWSTCDMIPSFGTMRVSERS